METKFCKPCNRELPVTEFTPRRDRANQPFAAYCKACDSAYHERYHAARTPEQLAHKAELSREWELQRNFGISRVEYDHMVDIQAGVCASCGRAPTGKGAAAILNVDHDHDTGAVRGLLCNPCNQSLGLMKDSPEMVEKLLNYARYAESLRTEIPMKDKDN